MGDKTEKDNKKIDIFIDLICTTVNDETLSALKSLSERFCQIYVYSIDINDDAFEENTGIKNIACSDKHDALRRILKELIDSDSEVDGSVICDMDFCFSAQDIFVIVDSMKNAQGRFVASVRRKSQQNGMARYERYVAGAIYKGLHGKNISDAWTGLIGIPKQIAATIFEIVETNNCQTVNSILSKLYRYDIKLLNEYVQCPYTRESKATNTSRIKDIIKLIWLPAKFIMSSSLSTISDYFIFTAVYFLSGKNNNLSYVAGRVAGVIVGYIINRTVVFRGKMREIKKELITLSKYLLLAIGLFVGSFTLYNLLNTYLNVFLAKVIADGVMFFINYTLQRKFVFTSKVKKTVKI